MSRASIVLLCASQKAWFKYTFCYDATCNELWVICVKNLFWYRHGIYWKLCCISCAISECILRSSKKTSMAERILALLLHSSALKPIHLNSRSQITPHSLSSRERLEFHGTQNRPFLRSSFALGWDWQRMGGRQSLSRTRWSCLSELTQKLQG